MPGIPSLKQCFGLSIMDCRWSEKLEHPESLSCRIALSLKQQNVGADHVDFDHKDNFDENAMVGGY